MTRIGLRIDVDTFRGTRIGVPALRSILKDKGIKGTFYLTVGPDNMGRHLFRLLRPRLLLKLIRSSAPSLYGWDIIFKGTLWPGPRIGKKLRQVLASLGGDGHEIGLHAWDHHAWQIHIDTMNAAQVRSHLSKADETLCTIFGAHPVTSAAPGWRISDTALESKEPFNFTYNSDCRGISVFFPIVNGVPLKTPQIPVTLPTYDEVIGRNGVTQDNYNQYLLSCIKPDGLNILTIHAESEGGSCKKMFKGFLETAIKMGIEILPLGAMLSYFPPREHARIIQGTIPGRDGWLGVQKEN